jgi:HAD superfamily hydrolase (TIGR01509 family)
MLEALIFDVDGVLADTEEAHRLAFNRAFDTIAPGWHWSRDEYLPLLRVTGGKERLAAWIAALLVPAAERERLRALIPALHAEKTRVYTQVVRDGGVPLRPGIERLMLDATDAGCRLGIASTTSAANIDALLAATLGPRGLDLFDAIVCGDQVPAKKPAPDVYRLALATLGVEPEDAAAVEDSANGLRSARGAGLWTLVTPTFWTTDDDFEGAGLVLPNGLGDDFTFAELSRLARPERTPSVLASLYEGASQ